MSNNFSLYIRSGKKFEKLCNAIGDILVVHNIEGDDVCIVVNQDTKGYTIATILDGLYTLDEAKLKIQSLQPVRNDCKWYMPSIYELGTIIPIINDCSHESDGPDIKLPKDPIWSSSTGYPGNYVYTLELIGFFCPRLLDMRMRKYKCATIALAKIPYKNLYIST